MPSYAINISSLNIHVEPRILSEFAKLNFNFRKIANDVIWKCNPFVLIKVLIVKDVEVFLQGIRHFLLRLDKRNTTAFNFFFIVTIRKVNSLIRYFNVF